MYADGPNYKSGIVLVLRYVDTQRKYECAMITVSRYLE